MRDRRLALFTLSGTFRRAAYSAVSGRQETELPGQAVDICGPAFTETNHWVLQSKGFKAQTSKVRRIARSYIKAAN
ncbi:hypothetical protein D8666_07295 [Ochrobactrum soli]|nr:hypothetical protein D8666_07295 [[Ochrobactrum] soli]